MDTPPAISANVTLGEITADILPVLPTIKILLPMNTHTGAKLYFRSLKRWIMAASAK